MTLSSLHITVVGGAIGGATAALLLARAGARVTLYEKVAHPRAVGAGIGLAENGRAVLDGLGLGPALHPHTRRVGPARIVDARGRPLLDPPSPPMQVDMLRRSDLHRVLFDALGATPNVELHTGAELVRATPAGDVTVRTSEGEATHGAALVIGADGVHSRVRAGGDFGARMAPPGIVYLRGLAPAGLARHEEAWTSAGLFGSFPVAEGTYFYASTGSPAVQAALAARDLRALQEAWARAYAPAGPLFGAVASFDDLLLNAVQRVDCARWADGRLVLLGDAAHAMAPNLGQGANSALVDAAVLLDALRTEADVPAALAAYEARRRPAVQKVADLSARLGGLAEVTSPLLRGLRDHVLLPLVRHLPTGDIRSLVLQEDPATLRGLAAP